MLCSYTAYQSIEGSNEPAIDTRAAYTFACHALHVHIVRSSSFADIPLAFGEELAHIA